jgi:hypothetical protein
MKELCPICHQESVKVIYYGLPVHFCPNYNKEEKEDCNCMWGFWMLLLQHLPYNGILFQYTGSYFIALLYWLFGNSEKMKGE